MAKQQKQQGGKKTGSTISSALRGDGKREKLTIKKGQSRKAARQARHPKYVESVITCGCGNVIQTRSTRSEINVEVCSSCHPFYSGSSKFVDTLGRVDRFTKKFGSDYFTRATKKKTKPGNVRR